MTQHVGFGSTDQEALRALGPLLDPSVAAITQAFYAALQQNAPARELVERRSSFERLDQTLQAWLRGCFEGPWDAAYYEQRARTGLRHVEIGVEPRFVIAGMNVVRREVLDRVLALDTDAELTRTRVAAVERMFDLEVIVMLHAYGRAHAGHLLRTERLATFGLLGSAMAHELRNPLGVIESSLYLIRQRGVADEDIVKHLDRIGRQVDRSNRLIGSLLDLARDKPVQAQPVDVNALIREAIADVSSNGQAIEASVPIAVTVTGDAEQLRQVLDNLLRNASEAAGAEGRIQVAVEPANDRIRLVVSDSGAGIHPSIAERLFEPLVTTKSTGVGLGLALSRKIVEAHGGSLQLTDGPLVGASFAVELPRRGD
jgi:signal transduction histidine kinase